MRGSTVSTAFGAVKSISSSVAEAADHYDALVRSLGQSPVVIGHSVGGLVVQMLLGRGLGAAGVAIDPAPARGLGRPSLSMLRSTLPTLWNLARARRTIPLASVDFSNGERAPLLLIASGQDHIFPVPLTRSSFRRYRQSPAITAYKQFPERSHHTIGEPGWEQVADYVLRWSMEQALTRT